MFAKARTKIDEMSREKIMIFLKRLWLVTLVTAFSARCWPWMPTREYLL